MRRLFCSKHLDSSMRINREPLALPEKEKNVRQPKHYGHQLAFNFASRLCLGRNIFSNRAGVANNDTILDCCGAHRVCDALDACHLEHFGSEALAELTSSMGLPHNCRDSLLCTPLHATKLGVTICNFGLRRCLDGGRRTLGSSIIPFFGCRRANDIKENPWADSRFLRSGYLDRWKRVYIYWLRTGNTWASCLLRGCRVLCSKLNCNAPSAGSGSHRSCRSPSCLWFVNRHTRRLRERRLA